MTPIGSIEFDNTPPSPEEQLTGINTLSNPGNGCIKIAVLNDTLLAFRRWEVFLCKRVDGKPQPHADRKASH